MGKHSQKHHQSQATQDDAMWIARGIQRPGRHKEQTKLIAQVIQKGIEQFKKRQNAKARELDKNLKKVKRELASPDMCEIEAQEKIVYRQYRLPLALLVISWLTMAAYWFVYWKRFKHALRVFL